MTRIRIIVAAFAIGAMLALSGAGPASAAPSDGYGAWTIAGATTAFTGTVTLPLGFPATTFTSTSRAPAPVSSGASSWISASSSFGAVFGSSLNKPYLSIRPRADNATSPSSTVYTFATPTPIGGWGVTLGDIDAERITISATDAAGDPVSGAALGVTTYNYCVAPGASCAGTSVPTATAAPTTVTIEEPGCPAVAGQCTTDGEAAWVNPTVALKTLTVTSQWKQGFPAYQTWFATVARAIGGTLSTSCAATAPLSAQLLDGSGAVVATSAVTAGAFSFPQVAARSDYVVRADPSTLPTGAVQVTASANTLAGDATGLVTTSSCPVAPPPPPPVTIPADPAVPTLAATGIDPSLTIIVGLFLLAAGVTLRTRRRG